MTQQGAAELYMWLMAAWPLVIKANSSKAFQNAKIEQLFESYKGYSDEEVKHAYEKWTEENEKWPSTKNILTEIKWARARKGGKRVDPTERYQMEIITDDGTEFLVERNGTTMFTLEEFMNLPRNKDHLPPDEWERRYQARRKRMLRDGKPMQQM